MTLQVNLISMNSFCPTTKHAYRKPTNF